MKLGVGRFNRLAQKLLQIKGGSSLPQLSAELLATLVVESDRPEWAYLMQQGICSGSGEPPGVAAQISAVRLRNPANSGVIAVLDAMMVLVNSTQLAVRRGTQNADLPASQANRHQIDSRYPLAQLPVCTVSQSTNYATTDATDIGNLPMVALTPVFIRPPRGWCILAPGSHFDINGPVNAAVQAMLWWYERQQEDSET